MWLRTDATFHMKFRHEQVPHLKLYRNSLEHSHSVTFSIRLIPAKYQIGSVKTFTLEWNQYREMFGCLICNRQIIELCIFFFRRSLKDVSRRAKAAEKKKPKCWIVNEPLSDKSLPIYKTWKSCYVCLLVCVYNRISYVYQKLITLSNPLRRLHMIINFVNIGAICVHCLSAYNIINTQTAQTERQKEIEREKARARNSVRWWEKTIHRVI